MAGFDCIISKGYLYLFTVESARMKLMRNKKFYVYNVTTLTITSSYRHKHAVAFIRGNRHQAHVK